jgi:hypothetical protein
MYRRGRPARDNFVPGEVLYRRHRRTDTKNGVILPSALQFPKKTENTGQSVNRSSFSKPEDVLWTPKGRQHGFGVFQFPVSCLPASLTCRESGRRFTFFPKHVPLWNNYAHSEVWCDEIPGKNQGYVLPTSVVKKEVRATIQKHSRIVIAADVAETGLP